MVTIQSKGYNDYGIFASSPNIEISQTMNMSLIETKTSTMSTMHDMELSDFCTTTQNAFYWMSWGQNEETYIGFGGDLYQNGEVIGITSVPSISLYSLDMQWIDITYNGPLIFYTHDCTVTLLLSLFNNISNSYFNVGDYIEIEWDLLNADSLSIPIRIYSNNMVNIDYSVYLLEDNGCLLCSNFEDSHCVDCDEGIYIQDLVTYNIYNNNYSVMVEANSSVLNLQTDSYYFQRNVVDIYVQIENIEGKNIIYPGSELYLIPIFQENETIQPDGTVFVSFDAAFNVSFNALHRMYYLNYFNYFF